MLNGIDVLHRDGFAALRGKRLGLLCNQASVLIDGRHVLDALIAAQASAGFEIRAVFGPQHGIWGHTQDDMIEWEGYHDPRTGLPFYSLYGETRIPRKDWLADLDLFVVDIQDVGARYYTFIWSMAHCMEACAAVGLPVLVLDRANPIGGVAVEGTVLDPAFSSFVGLHPLPMRHGMTVGEIARYLQARYYPGLSVDVTPLEGWNRGDYFDQTDLLWAPPSPNMPTVDTAVVYPGGCLIEGTNLSEGRGTTRPFEIVGAPWLDGWQLADRLNGLGLTGVYFRPIQFQPTFHKFAGEICGGVFVHALDRSAFTPVLGYIAILRAAIELGGGRFAWKQPPYEYETERMPFDILAGNGWLRGAIESGTALAEIEDRMRPDCEDFEPLRREALIFD